MAAKDRLYKGQPGTLEANLFTASKDYEGLCIWVVNNTASAATLTLYHTDAQATPQKLPFLVASVPANGDADFRVPVRVLAGEKVSGLQGTAGALTVFIDGVVS